MTLPLLMNGFQSGVGLANETSDLPRRSLHARNRRKRRENVGKNRNRRKIFQRMKEARFPRENRPISMISPPWIRTRTELSRVIQLLISEQNRMCRQLRSICVVKVVNTISRTHN